MKVFMLALTLFIPQLTMAKVGDVKEIPFKVNYKPHSELKNDEAYFEIDKVTVTEIRPLELASYNSEKNDKTLGEVILTIEKLIALGTKIYEIIKKGKPVTNLSFAKPVSVLPDSEDPNTAFSQMSGWSMPMAKSN